MRKNIQPFASMLLVLFAITFVAPEAQSLESGSPPQLHYHLPRNYFRFQFTMKTSSSAQGEFCDLIPYFFDAKEQKPDECNKSTPVQTVSAEVGSAVSVTELAEPDPDQQFDLPLGSGIFNETTLTLNLGEGNVLTGFQATNADHKVDFFISILNTAAGIASHLIHPPGIAAPKPPNKEPVPQANATDCSLDLDEGERALLKALGKRHRDFACGLKNSESRSFYLNIPERFRAYVDAYVDDGHELDVHFLNAVKTFIEYAQLTEDEAQFLHPERLPAASQGFSEVESAREKKIKDIRSSFFGTSDTRTDEGPDVVWHFPEMGKEVELFSFDSLTDGGVCFNQTDPTRWFARTINVAKCADLKPGSMVSVIAVIYPEKGQDGALPDNSGKGSGIAYRIPGRGSLRVFARKKDNSEFDYFRTSFDIAQLGTVRYLPPRIGNNTQYSVSLDPLTGNLTAISVAIKPVLTGDTGKSLSDLSTSLLGVVDAYHAAQKKPNQLDTLQSQEQLSKEQLKIQLLESCKGDPTQSFCSGLLQ